MEKKDRIVLLREEQLDLVLKANSGKIGNLNGWEPFISAFVFFLSGVFANYPSWWGIPSAWLKGLVILIACGLMLRGVYLALKDRKYTYKDLFMEIKNQNEITHPFSIVVVKDEFNKYPDRFLVYYDTRWKCRLFLNYHTQDNPEENEAKIKDGLSHDLHVEESDIKMDCKDVFLHKKYSYSDQCEKWYEHTIYQAHISNLPENEHSDSFEMGGRQYYWMSLAEMERDQTIMEKNSDIVSYVKQLII